MLKTARSLAVAASTLAGLAAVASADDAVAPHVAQPRVAIVNADGTPYVDAPKPVAEQPTLSGGYFGAGFMMGSQRQAALELGGAVEVGIRASDTDVFAHVMVAGGDSGFFTDGGSFYQLRAGAEYRRCIAKDLICGALGADLGFQHEDAVTNEWIIGGEIMETVADDLIAVPRITADYGGAMRFRTTVEMPLRMNVSGDTDKLGYGVSATGGVAFVF